MLSIATWNVNSVRSRLTHLTTWLKESKPDVVLLQELKCTDDQFPAMEIEELGYNIATHGEKTYNGVAILSRYPLDDVKRGLPNEPLPKARYIEAVVCHPELVTRVASVYVPNGQTADSDKFPYKLAFLDALYMHLQTLRSYDEAVVIGGDYNIAPTDEDVADPKSWAGSVLTHSDVRKKWRMLINTGFADACIAAGGNRAAYTWWDYRAGAYMNNDGLRIDHILASPQAADKIKHYEVVKHLRELEKPSDHAPVMITLG